MLEDPKSFIEDHIGERIVLDEIYRLPDPVQILKVSADHFLSTKIIVTGSSSLQASRKFKNTLTNRKEEIWLTPMITEDLSALVKRASSTGSSMAVYRQYHAQLYNEVFQRHPVWPV